MRGKKSLESGKPNKKPNRIVASQVHTQICWPLLSKDLRNLLLVHYENMSSRFKLPMVIFSQQWIKCGNYIILICTLQEKELFSKVNYLPNPSLFVFPIHTAQSLWKPHGIRLIFFTNKVTPSKNTFCILQKVTNYDYWTWNVFKIIQVGTVLEFAHRLVALDISTDY